MNEEKPDFPGGRILCESHGRVDDGCTSCRREKWVFVILIAVVFLVFCVYFLSLQ